MSRKIFVTALAALALTPAQADVDLAAKYPGALAATTQPVGHACTTTPDDVWRLSAFSLRFGEELMLDGEAAQLVVGHSGEAALWAAVLFDQPARLQSSFLKAGERVATVWLRFHPQRLGKLFPAETVRGLGDASSLLQARRLAGWKMTASYHVNNLPMVPPEAALVVDMETTGGARRFFTFDPQKQGWLYIAAFDQRPLPALTPIEAEKAAAAFDEVWTAFDREYAMFALKKDVDWPELRQRYHHRAESAATTYELAVVLAELLAHFEDLHVGVRVKDEWIPCFDRERPLNASFEALQAALPNLTRSGRQLLWAKSDDGIGYINVAGLGDKKLPDLFDDALDRVGGCWALVLDLRFNGGGDETLGQKMAGRFADRAYVYSLSQYRDGPEHDDLTERKERRFEPRGPWRWPAPVVVLQGRRTMSSAESFALMLAQCPNVTTIGEPTAGSSGNPRELTVAGEIHITLPRWIDLDPDGKPIDFVGVRPDVRREFPPEQFTRERDPLLDAALERLRETPAEQRKPAHAESG